MEICEGGPTSSGRSEKPPDEVIFRWRLKEDRDSQVKNKQVKQGAHWLSQQSL